MERENLSQEMKFKDLFFLAFGIYAGVAWVTTLGAWLKHGTAASILGFTICGIMLIPIGLCYAELSPAIKVAGGGLAFTYKAFGLFPSTIVGWFMALAYIIVCPYEAISVSILLNYMFPGLNIGALYTIQGFTIYFVPLLIGIAFSIFFTYINYKGVGLSAKFQTIASAILLIMIVAFLVLGFAKGNVSNMKPWIAPNEGSWQAIFGVFGMAPFFLAGFDAIPQSVEEADKKLKPTRIGFAIILAILFGIFFYVVTTMAAALAAPWQTTVKQSLPTAYAFEQIFGKGFDYIVLFGALLGLLTTWNGCFITGSRILFAMGRGRLIPQVFAKVHPQFKTPTVAILFTGFISVLGPFIGKAGLIPAVDVGSLAFVVSWLAVSLSAIKLRKSYPDMERPYKMPGGTLMGGIAVIVCIIFMGLLVVPGSPSALVWPTEWIVLFIWIVLGICLYVFWTKHEQKNISEQDYKYLILGESKNSSISG